MSEYNKTGGDFDISDIENLFLKKELNEAIQNFDPSKVDNDDAEIKTAKLVEKSTKKGKKSKKTIRDFLKENDEKIRIITAGALAAIMLVAFALGFMEEKLKYRKPAIDMGDSKMTEMMLECGAIKEDEKGNLVIDDLGRLSELGLDDSDDLFFAIRVAEKAKGHDDILYADEIAKNIANPENNGRPYINYEDALFQMGYVNPDTKKPSDLVFNNMHFGKLEEIYKDRGEEGYEEYLDKTLGTNEVKGGTHK